MRRPGRRAINVITGADAAAYDDGVVDAAVPVLVTAGRATVVEGAGLALVVPADAYRRAESG